MRKRIVLVAAAIALTACLCLGLVACYDSGDKKYFQKVSEYTFWENSGDTAIAQTRIHDIVMKHMTENNGKIKKTAVIGFDGARTDALINVLRSGVADKEGNETLSPDIFDTDTSGVNALLNTGGKAYLSFAGGEKGKDTEQYTSTAPGWTAQMTGVWGKDNGIVNNDDYKKIEYKSYLLKCAEDLGLRTAFASSWSTHFTNSYLDEIEYLDAHKDIGMRYDQVADDKALYDYYISAVTENSENERDVIMGIFEPCDHMGHAYGFGNKNFKYAVAMRHNDNIAYKIIEKIRGRSNYQNEDWLIILTTDHGGINTWHGNQTLEERTTWIVTNKPIDKGYYSSGYDGYRIGK